MLNYLPIDKASIPYNMEIKIAEETFGMEVKYNAEFDFFTVDLYKNEELLVVGEKIVYGVPLFDVGADSRFPKALFVPFDLAEQSEQVNWETIMNSVFIYILTAGDFIE